MVALLSGIGPSSVGRQRGDRLHHRHGGKDNLHRLPSRSSRSLYEELEMTFKLRPYRALYWLTLVVLAGWWYGVGPAMLVMLASLDLELRKK